MNYAEIVALALSYADRTDAEVANRVDDFLRVVESRINRVLKTMDMSTRTTTITITDKEYYTLPDDFAGMRDIEIREAASSYKTTLQYLNPEQLNNISGLDGLKSVYYTIVANQIQIMPIQAAGKIIELIYYRKLIPLSTTFPENWLSLGNPDAYVFGLLTEIHAFLKDKESIALWDTRFKEVLADIHTNDSMSRWSGTPLRIRSE